MPSNETLGVEFINAGNSAPTMTTTTLGTDNPTTSSEKDIAQAVGADAQIQPGEIAVGVVIGRASEYFDFFVYGIASALVFPSIFFPFADRLTGTLYAFAVFSVAFLARPFGTALSMLVQRRYGRQAKLASALFLLGTSTAGIAFLPGYERIGSASIVLLAVLRVAQGLALSAPPNRRGWYAMLGQLGAPLGFGVAAALFAFLTSSLTSEDFLSWGWRYPFYVAFAINVVALFARLRLVAATTYSKLLDERELAPTAILEIGRAQGANILIGAFAALSSYALFHVVTIFPLSWVTLYSEQPVSEFLVVQLIGAVLCAIAMVASGKIADRIGRRSTLGALAVMIAIFSGFAFTLMDGGAVGQDAFILIGFVLLGLSYGQASGTVTANFQGRYRYTGAALTADTAWLIGAAFAPLVVLGLSANFGLGYISVYLLSGCAATLAALFINRKLGERDQENDPD
jgi:MFS family permease